MNLPSTRKEYVLLLQHEAVDKLYLLSLTRVRVSSLWSCHNFRNSSGIHFLNLRRNIDCICVVIPFWVSAQNKCFEVPWPQKKWCLELVTLLICLPLCVCVINGTLLKDKFYSFFVKVVYRCSVRRVSVSFVNFVHTKFLYQFNFCVINSVFWKKCVSQTY